MPDARRNQLRKIMLTAWDFARAEPDRSFADCLRGAWRWVRKMAETAAKFMKRARGATRIDFSPSLIRSPIANSLRGTRYGGVADHKAAYLTSRLGY